MDSEKLSDEEQRVWPAKEKLSHGIPARRKKHSHHHHHRSKHHHTRGLTEQDSLESRIRTGLQTLQEEKKAIQNIVTEMEDASKAKIKEEMQSKWYLDLLIGEARGGVLPALRKICALK